MVSQKIDWLMVRRRLDAFMLHSLSVRTQGEFLHPSARLLGPGGDTPIGSQGARKRRGTRYSQENQQ